MWKRALFLLLICASMACASASPGLAQQPCQRGAYGPNVLPLDCLLPVVRNGRPGRFYDAEGPFPDPYGGYHYRIKWLTPQGRVIWFDADARSGRVLGVARGDWREQGPPGFGQYNAGPRPGPYRQGPYGPPRGGPRGGFGWHGGGGRGGHGHGH